MTTATTRRLSRRALNALTNAQLKELRAVDCNIIATHKANAIGHPGYFSCGLVRRERNQAKIERDAIDKILMRRQRAEFETMIDRDAHADAVAV